MAMRAATMNPMSPVDAPTILRESDSLLRKLVLLLLLISAAVLWIVIWFERETDFPLLLSTFFVDASLGLVAGFGARFLLRNRDPFLRYFVAIFIAVIGMLMIAFLTQSIFGIGPIQLEEKFAEQLQKVRFNNNFGNQIRSLGIGSRVLFDFSGLDWADLAHLAVSVVITALSLQAWRQTVPIPEPVEIAPLPVIAAPPVTRSRRGRKSTSSSNGRARVRRAESNTSHLTPTPQPAPRTRSNNGTPATGRAKVKKMKEPTVRPKKKRASQRKPKIQFALVEEHRCPYCLDAVTHNDPRGVKECEVCHTLHHADCWTITGVCQVPHLNT
jgi:hypothetical protein